MSNVIYLRLKYKRKVNVNDQIRLGDIAWISCAEELQSKLLNLFVYEVTENDQTYKVIDLYNIIKKIQNLYPENDIESVGPSQTILILEQPRTKMYPIYVFFIWTLLFIGAAMAVMNFHFDVSMPEVQEKLHSMMSGDIDRSVLWLQIPYSIGLGLGMILFFNHFLKKKFNEEPSPLEVEMFNYDQNLYEYVTFNENELNKNND
ncbi:stage V sporulation protein AA [Alkalibacillus haloalkaliphilus]|uniref:Stage V sporulation protein AA n=1 Tax=Alkalibacillus haloalkaliphilus TaxID=94136 RepID=A0A511W2B0_9BACI|nr:stage V sporulation protein AA [Alkalibacillus haloalkaliphilus]GEN45206.1 stage V sporulation protein AA [Alkalibacillus haloalkaliphilus]